MKTAWPASALLWSGLAVLTVASASAQTPATGAVEFVAHVTPAGGRPEPVRELTFYALRKSLADIRLETEKAEPPADVDRFIDGLDASSELKAWMKKRHTVDLAGSDFTKHLKGEDITDVPEFLDAYKAQYGGTRGGAFPEPKFKAGEEKTKPEKYQHEHEQYIEALRAFVAANPDSLGGLDAELADKNPSRRWAQVQAEQRRKADRRTLELAQTSYLAGKTDSDLNGRGSLGGLGPGTYWITTLDTPALAGDVRLLWDLAVTVRAGDITRVELSNLNAIEPPSRPAQ